MANRFYDTLHSHYNASPSRFLLNGLLQCLDDLELVLDGLFLVDVFV